MVTFVLTVLPGLLSGDHVVVTVYPPVGAPQSSGLMIPEIVEAEQGELLVDP